MSYRNRRRITSDRVNKLDVSVSELKSVMLSIKTAHEARVREIIEQKTKILDSITKIEKKNQS